MASSPVGTGIAARSAGKGVYHAAVRMTLNPGVPADGRTTPELGVLLCRPPEAGERRIAACMNGVIARADGPIGARQVQVYSAIRTAASCALNSSFPGASTNVSNSRK